MGTSADLAVRHQGRTFYQHVSYDGHTPSVLAQLAGTIAAMGAEALRERLAREADPTEEGEEDEVYLDRKAMGNAYIAACQARGKEPWNLDYALNYEYGNPDFSHGGAIPLLAPKIEWAYGFASSVEDTSVILDLDRGVLCVPAYGNNEEGQYDAGKLDMMWEIELAHIEDMDPQALAQCLEKADLDWDHTPEQRRAAIDNVLAQARLGGEVREPTHYENNHYRPRNIGMRDQFRPSIHFLRGLPDHIAYLQPIVDFLREPDQAGPVLAQDKTVMLVQDDGGLEVIVDLREGDLVTQNMVDELFEGVARAGGMIYRRDAEGTQRMVSMHSSMASAGTDGRKGEPWDTGLVPDDARVVGLDAPRIAMIEQAIAEGDQAQVHDQLMYAILGMNEARWRMLQDSGVVEISPQEMRQIASHAISLCTHFERAKPGSTRMRMDRLSEGQRSMLLEALDPVDRHILKQLMGPATSGKPGPRP